MSPPDVRDRLASYLPFVVVAFVGQLSVAWPPGPTNRGAFLASSLLLLLILTMLLVRRGMPPKTFVVGSALYMSSVGLLMVSSGGMRTGFGVLLFVPVVGVALYGRRWESAVCVVLLLSALVAVTLDTSTTTVDAAGLVRRLLLTGAIAAMLSVAIHVLRGRLMESNARTARLLQQEETLNAAVRELVQLSEPPQIAALGARLAMGMASPAGSEILRSSYFRIEDGMVVVDAQLDEAGTNIQGRWPVEEHPGLREAVASLEPVTAPLDPDRAGPTLRVVFDATGITYGAWVPVCPDGKLHGVLAIATRGTSLPKECIDRCVALGHFLELALSNWAAHRTLEEQATVEERRRIARELHDGLAHELAFIASKTRGAAAGTEAPPDARVLAGAADRALDEARRAITVLSVAQPQSLDDAISQTVEDLGSRLGVAWDLQLADDIEVSGEVRENLLRIVREAITNAASHGASEHIRVSLERDDQLRLVIEDDGCGFDTERGDAAGGFGLQSMHERAASVGAVLSVDSVPERGTRVAVAFG
ncbi:MAG TPA: sensor histidine kinase [Acidimicrobiales bacterium]